jgi:hypothetical protein
LVHVPAGIRHRFKNKTAHAARMIFLFTPGGPEEAFLQYSDPARPGELPPRSARTNWSATWRWAAGSTPTASPTSPSEVT